VSEQAGLGVEGTVQGKDAAGRLRLGSARFCGVPAADDTQAAQVQLADDGGWLASFELDETLRPGAAAAVAALRAMNLQLQVLSGDQDGSVQRLAGRAGIEQALGHQAPQDKLDHLAQLQRAGHRVAMVGDGMNDGPVLARADVGIALGEAVPLAQVRCDFIIQGGQLEGVAAIVAQARRARAVVRQNLLWAAAYNLVCVPLAVAGLMPAWLAGLGMAGSSLLVVLNAARLARLPSAVEASASSTERADTVASLRAANAPH
jgi:P-type Cu2+ transporter